jgi:hypothetical protein
MIEFTSITGLICVCSCGSPAAVRHSCGQQQWIFRSCCNKEMLDL